jgi:hypothetical protein
MATADREVCLVSGCEDHWLAGWLASWLAGWSSMQESVCFGALRCGQALSCTPWIGYWRTPDFKPTDMDTQFNSWFGAAVEWIKRSVE